MKKMALVVLVFLLLALTFPSIPKVSATTENLWTTPGLPEVSEPVYLNTTNPYSPGEGNDEEGSRPLYVLVFGDEEERERVRYWKRYAYDWAGWAEMQLERGDDRLVENFGIDIRILGFKDWDSDDSKDTMEDLWYELESDTEQYLGQWYGGEWWSNYVDAIIGITDQTTTDGAVGKAPGDDYLDQGKIFVLLKWQVYWADDNLVMHEVSHLYYAPDHDPPCCVMANHTHPQTVIYEDGAMWIVYMQVPCGYTEYDWCTSCHQVIQQNSERYPLQTLTISASSGGTTDPAPGTYTKAYGESVTVTASAYSGYVFDYWLLDDAKVYDNPKTVTMDQDHTVEAHFTPTYLFDGDFLEGWSCIGGDLWTNGDIGVLMIYPGYSSAVMRKSWTFDSAVLKFVTVSCTYLDGDSWRFEARRASDETWLYGPLISSADTKTWVITDWYTGVMDKVGLRVFGEWGDQAVFDFITITDNVTLTILADSGGTTNPLPGTYEYFEKTSVQVTATADAGYYFQYWYLDGQQVGGSSTITVTTDADHTLKAYFQVSGGGSGCPTFLVWNGSDYADYGVIDIHDVENDVVREVHIQGEDVSVAGYMVKFTLREGWEGLNFSHSLIDQVKLYAVDSKGNRYLCPLIKAEHSEQGKVLLKLLFSDDYRTDTYLMDTIDLTFRVPYPIETIENFTFIIEGHNPLKQ